MASTGLPIDVGCPAEYETFNAFLESMASRIGRQLAAGVDLAGVVAADSTLPEAYRSAFLAWLEPEGQVQGFERLVAMPLATSKVRQQWEVNASQLYLLLFLAYLAVLYILSFTVPKFAALNDQLQKPPGLALQVLLVLRTWMPLWGTAIPVILGPIGLRKLFRWGSASRAPSWGKHRVSESKLTRHIQQALKAERLLERNASHHEMQATTASPENLDLPVQVSDAEPKETAQAVVGNGPAPPAVLPPLLHWATHPTSDSLPQNRKLELAAASYWRLVDFQTSGVSLRWSTIFAAVVGSLIVLTVALAVFLPLFDFLLFVAEGN
ncbi:hypothetical protein [Aureliella helgolandensis]|uniref:hypothetical protein n=1 Tax=Aureliella helgolandensis TaxID=2527968 RepID=UPI00119E7F55|nr:hypothetical protein [Aureliella helgolandensis]